MENEYIKNPAKFLKSVSVDDLVALLNKAMDAYHGSDKPIMSDDLFDLALDHLRKIAPRNAFFKRVGAEIPEESKVTLPYWMGSLDKIRDSDKGIAKWVSTYSGNVVISDKLDGNSGLLVYKNGIKSLYTRGDGTKGQNISQLLQLGLEVPENIPSKYTELAVRGELIISKAKWDKKYGANARNVVAGILHQKNPKTELVNLVDFVVYELIHPRLPVIESFELLTSLGFKVVNYRMVNSSVLNSDYLSRILLERRDESAYEIDGIVVAHNEVHKLAKGSNPKYAFAFKTLLTHNEAEVVVSSVEWNVSKDGYIKPTVKFNTVTLNGVNISKATGFNAAFIENNKIAPGARVVIIRSGDVIPYITRVVFPADKPQMPEIPYEWNETHIDVKIKESSSGTKNVEQTMKQLEHFCKTMEMKFISSGTIKKFVEQGNIHSIPELLKMSKEDLHKIEGFKAASVARVYKSLQDTLALNISNKDVFIQFMVASGLLGRGLGMKKIEPIIEACPEIMNRQVPSVEKVESVEGIGAKTAKEFITLLPKFYEFIDEIGLKKKSITPPRQKEVPKKTGQLSEKTIVFTGFRNSEWEKIIKAAGGKVSTSISKKTDLVVAADVNEDSSKIQKAKELGIKLISKTEFENKYL